jgi:hypothetical protein
MSLFINVENELYDVGVASFAMVATVCSSALRELIVKRRQK